MSKKFKAAASLFLSLMLIFVAVPQVSANEPLTAGGFVFQVVEGHMSITGYTGPAGAVLIPAAAPNGQLVTAIGAGAFQNVNISSVTFVAPSSIQFIGREAFRASNINRIYLPGSVTVIGEGAFESATGLTEITLPSNLRTIGSRAFAGTRLVRITVPATVTDVANAAFTDIPTLTEAHFSHLDGRNTSINMGNNVFDRPHADFRITFLPNAANFGLNWYPPHRAYSSTAAASSDDWVFTPLAGTDIMITGFRANSPLNTAARIEIPSQIDNRTVRRIQSRAFDHLSNLQEVVIPSTINNIEARAFNNNPLMIAAYFLHNDGNAVTLEADAFTGGHSNFSIFYQYGAANFTTPNWRGFPARAANVEAVWEFAPLSGTNELMITAYTGTATVVEIPATLDGRPVRYIGNEVFRENRTVTEIIFHDNIASVAANAVFNAPNLVTARLLHTNAADIDMSSLAFSGVHRDFRIIFPGNATGFTTPTWAGFAAEPDLISANWEHTVANNAVTINRYLGSEEHVTIPDYIGQVPVRVIASEAFRDNNTIERVTIPANVTTVEPRAFFNSINLYSARLLHSNANQFTNFSTEAFVGVSPQFRIIFSNDATGFTTPTWNGYFASPEADELTLRDGDYEFIIQRENVPGMTGATRDVAVITRYLGTATEVEIPSVLGEGGFPVTGIGDFAFQANTSIRTAVIASSVRNIGHSAFQGASALAEVVFLHADGTDIELHANTFRYTADNFVIIFHADAQGFTTPTWQGWPTRPHNVAAPTDTDESAEPGQQGEDTGLDTDPDPGEEDTDALPVPPTPPPPAAGQLNNPLIHSSRVLDSLNPFMSSDGYMLQAPIFRLEPFAPNPNYSTSYVMVRVIADILGLDWAFHAPTNTATFTGYNADNQFIVMELMINNTTMRVNGIPTPVRATAGVVPAISRDGRLFVPVLVFQEVFGVTIRWNGADRTVTVNP